MRSVFVRFYCIPFSVLLFSPQKTRFRNTSNQLNYCQFECEGTEFAVVAAAAAASLHTHKRTHSYLFTSCCYLNKIYSSRSSFSFRLFFFTLFLYPVFCIFSFFGCFCFGAGNFVVAHTALNLWMCVGLYILAFHLERPPFDYVKTFQWTKITWQCVSRAAWHCNMLTTNAMYYGFAVQ